VLTKGIAGILFVMNVTSMKVQKTYLVLLAFNTLAASLIWGINTLFLLDAGLNNLEAFAANAFFTVGMVLFEIPTGIIADLRGRRVSYLLGTITLSVATLLYLLMWQTHAPFWAWAAASMSLGLGFTFFSGAVEAWLVDALQFSGFTGKLESVLAKGQIVTGIMMLAGSVAGGVIAQATNLGVPYIMRAGILVLTFVLAFALMKDIGFTPARSGHPLKAVKVILHNSIQYGLRRPSVRWVMLTAPFTSGATFYAFYAMQPYLLELYGDEKAYGIAGLAAAIVAGAQIIGGMLVPHIGRLFHSRTVVILIGVLLTTLTLALSGLIPNFWIVLAALVIWAVVFAATIPVRQSYIHSMIPTDQRATVISFDALFGSGGGAVTQPILGKVADIGGYPASYLVSAGFSALAIPFALLAHRARTTTDVIPLDTATPIQPDQFPQR
jgi:MFS family permease